MNDASSAPTVVLVHGAFADAGSFAEVTGILIGAGISVLAPANPLRGLTDDSAYIAGVFAQVPGRVLAVGHSYAGAVITNAASMASNVTGLVFIAAFAPDEGEALSEVTVTSKDSTLGPALVPQTYPVGDTTGTEFLVDRAAFPGVFADDLAPEKAAVYAASQRPIAAAAFDERTGVPAWKTLPSWSIVATGDKAAGTDLVRSMAVRAGADTVELDGSHLIMVSRPADVARVIMRALNTIG